MWIRLSFNWVRQLDHGGNYKDYLRNQDEGLRGINFLQSNVALESRSTSEARREPQAVRLRATARSAG